MQEQELVKLLLNREEEGLSLLLKHYGPLMRYVISPILQDPQDREECLSETVMRIWEKIGQFDRERGNWNAWITAVARNSARNRLRKQIRTGNHEEIPEETPSPEETPEEQLLARERQEMLRKALDQLSQKEKVLIYRKYYYNQPISQIAAEMGMTERAAEGKLYRLKKRLRGMLGGALNG